MTESISDKKSIIFAGGGTGGHLLPGIAVAEQLDSQNEFQILFVGSNRPVEQQIIESAGYQHLRLPSSSTSDLKRTPIRFLWNNGRAFLQARRFLRKEKPAVVIGLGGFASVPVVIAASWLRIPVVLLEQNIIAGRANQFLFSRSNLVCTSFAETSFKNADNTKSDQPRIVFTGNPVRKNILKSASSNETIINKVDRTLILVLGGSQGATAVNDAIISMLKQCSDVLLCKLHLVHQTGSHDYRNVEKAYQQLKEIYPELQVTVQPFIENLSEWYSQVDLVISRAGATTLAELACVGCPTVLIPFPDSIGDHQLLNARFFEDSGAAVLVEQAQEIASTAKLLWDVVLALLTDCDQRNKMRQSMRDISLPQAARDVAVEVTKLLN
ncbi:MAG: undecaprenyldiphospho-muramoylpentapeptide beta-N-acetylglucosaminyltransferase [Planctomycetes bacterium]|nr:undecaprenyldiphospho-muramoylpentapeptide beta-N-acetylglucosaminyltransferase [Planctomycetota bacterium]MCH9723578.1 undecaprenyldiphospho-muramoylpentapeptide beta-N-acetylglucosaminyltransferase [Planctomycetota bacterium]MCH9775123.1 undecaprenyldiphospho-muramoylpentapeptide beta-N-acetylglucosaminyltransferase [Planctomycetota bacterium]